MSFLAPSTPAAPAPPPPPPNPPIMASSSVKQAGAATRAAAAAAAGNMGLSDTVKTSPMGDLTQTGSGKAQLLGGGT